MYDTTDFAVFEKPAGLPSAPLNKKDTKNTAVTQICETYPEVLCVSGKKKVEYGLIHRIDTNTRGLLLVAKNQKAFDYFQKEQKAGRFIKTYAAFCYDTSQHLTAPFVLKSRFRPFGPGRRMVSPVNKYDGRAAQKKAGNKTYTTEVLHITPVKANTGSFKIVRVDCKIDEGFRHQVRAHLSWTGLPIIGDRLYGIKSDQHIPMQFFANGLQFYPLPNTENENKLIKIMLPNLSFSEEFFSPQK